MLFLVSSETHQSSGVASAAWIADPYVPHFVFTLAPMRHTKTYILLCMYYSERAYALGASDLSPLEKSKPATPPLAVYLPQDFAGLTPCHAVA